MKFFVRRTSIWNKEESPCDGAKRVKGLITHNGAAKTLEQTKDPKWYGNFWFWDKDKINHRETNSGVACDSEALLWQIELESLEQLMAFIEANAELFSNLMKIFMVRGRTLKSMMTTESNGRPTKQTAGKKEDGR